MPSRKQWVFAPDSGGRKIPEAVKQDVSQRIERIARRRYAGRYTRLAIRFRGQFCYIDAYREPTPVKNWPPKDWPETRDEYLERLRNAPVHLCRLRSLGMSVGALGFTRTAMKSMSCRYFGTANFSENRKRRFKSPQTFICWISPPGGRRA